ncbi:hypothetical protein CEUSTIGMA_g1569.t1 [Chlamydomonas eustigma]|uniref:Uncharacterized protein n=1 Tax=Chlamydomonas eustigma TaxID=1157962 RepID=A0A250WU80_9CHLO|nr:hypothetical protein CEUSTIGMA_g1569.t1 [Chlamydomonas eustigma]|eukprot:GAX74120.1 hypothetical protein CEUSTIGMA_g1569.t1 [Chlamydomonas eustigma]
MYQELESQKGLKTHPSLQTESVVVALSRMAHLHRKSAAGAKQPASLGNQIKHERTVDSAFITELLGILLNASLSCLKFMTWSQLSKVLWSLAVLRHHPGEQWVEAAMTRCSRDLGFSQVGIGPLAVSLWAMAKLGIRPKRKWLMRCRKALLLKWRLYPARPLCLSLWAIARMGHQPPVDWLQRTIWHVLLHMVLYPTPEVWRNKTSPVLSIAPDQHHLTSSQMSDGPGALPDGDVRGPAKSSSIMALMATLQRNHSQGGYRLYRYVGLNPTAAHAAEAIQTLLPAGAASFEGISGDWYRELQYRALPHLRYGGITGQQYTMVLHSLSCLMYKPSDKWMGAFYGGSGALMARQGLLDMLSLKMHQVERRPVAKRRAKPVGYTWRSTVSYAAAGKQRVYRKAPLRKVFRDASEERLHWQNVLGLIHTAIKRRRQQKLPGSQKKETSLATNSSLHHDDNPSMTVSSSSKAQGIKGRQAGSIHPPPSSPSSRPSLHSEGSFLHGASADDPSTPAPTLLGPKDLACLLWCLARIQEVPPTWWVRLYEALLLYRLSSLSVQEMVTILYGYGALRRRPPRLLLRNLLQLTQTRWKHLGTRGAANVLVALARLKMPPHRGWVYGLLKQSLFPDASKVAKRLSQQEKVQQSGVKQCLMRTDAEMEDGCVVDLTFEGASRLLWALGTLDIDPGEKIVEVLTRKVHETGGMLLQEIMRKRENLHLQISRTEDLISTLLEEGGLLQEEMQEPLSEEEIWNLQLLKHAFWGISKLGYEAQL